MKFSEFTPSIQYLVRLEREENVVASLFEFCTRKEITNAVFSAIGAVKHAKVGYYDLTTKQYGSKVYEEEYEVASMTGNVALVDGKPFCTYMRYFRVSLEEWKTSALAGMFFEATVAVTLEVFMTVFSESMERKLDEAIGLKLLDCREGD